MIRQPWVEDRHEQHYVGIRAQVPMRQLGNTIPRLLGELFSWLGQRRVAPSGPPFIRYHVINMAAAMDIELGIPVATALPGDGRIGPGVLPAGRYAALVYTGRDNGIAGNAALLDWGTQRGLVWDRWSADNGDAFGARYESFLTAPDEEPDPRKWETEVAIRLADGVAEAYPAREA
jgi:effector-binding domain-containing protein